MVSPAAAAPRPISPTPAPAGVVRSGLANGIRDVGDGVFEATRQIGITADKTSIYPIESVYTVGKDIGKGISKLPVVGKFGGTVGTVIGFLGAVQGMMLSSLLRAPGEVAKDTASLVADQIDGQKTPRNGFGYGWFLNGMGGAGTATSGQQAISAK